MPEVYVKPEEVRTQREPAKERQTVTGVLSDAPVVCLDCGHEMTTKNVDDLCIESPMLFTATIWQECIHRWGVPA